MTSCAEPGVLERFVAGTASRRECRVVVRHLLARCGVCAGLLRSAVGPTIEGEIYGFDGAMPAEAAVRGRHGQ